MLSRLRTLSKRALPLVRSTLRHRIRVSAVYVPIYTLLLATALLIATVVFTILSYKESIRQQGLRSHQRYDDLENDVFVKGCRVPALETERANASLVMLARNEEVADVVKSMKSLERHFNQWYGYPWIFLNDVEFTEEFKHEVTRYTKSECHFGVIDDKIWNFPDESSWKFKEGIETQGDRGVMYGPMTSYHKMCRFYSGGFYKHPLVRKFEWYWRVEPDVDFFCDITYDPFIEMAKSGKKYGFTVMIKELVSTIPNLFRYTKSFMRKKEILPKSAWKLFVKNYREKWKTPNKRRYEKYYKNIHGLAEFKDRVKEVILSEKIVDKMHNVKEEVLTDEALNPEQLDALITLATQRSRLPTLQGEAMDEEDYNLFHFWSNFEIARVDLWDNPLYEEYYRYLEDNGGFSKERWGDAPVHSLAVGMMLDLSEVHYFRDIGYQHSTIRHCPANHKDQLPYEGDYTTSDPKFDQFWSKVDPVKDYGLGCRCRCPTKTAEIEDTGNDFLKGWFELVQREKEPPKQYNVVKQERKMREKLRKEGLM